MHILQLCTTWFILAVTAYVLLQAAIFRRMQGVKRLVSAYKSVQLLVFAMLVKVQLPAHIERYIASVLQNVTLWYIDVDSILESNLSLKKKEDALDVHFSQMGFKSSDSIFNMGSTVVILLACALIANLALFATYADSTKGAMRDYFDSFKGGKATQSFHLLVDWAFMFAMTCCSISYY